MDLLALLIGLVIGVLLGGVAALLYVRSRPSAAGEDPALVEARHAAELAQLRSVEQARLAEMRAEEQAVQARLSAELASVHATASAFRAQIVGLQEQQRELVDRQRAEHQAQTERDRAESKVLQALTPVQENLRAMQLKVTELETQRSLQHGELSQQLKAANESEERLRATAESLASALKSNSTRGVWGETQLRNVVQAAGLIERVDFDVQSSISSDAGSGRPDMVVHLPGGKNIAVDAKVPFNSYLEASQIPVTATGEEAVRREQLIKQHVKALRAHIDALASKTYWAGLEASPELVIAFIPSESLVSSAMEADPSIMDYAFGKRVALSSPVTLWSVLKTVAFSWQQDVLTEDAKQLFDLSRELYTRLAKLSEHIEKLGRSIESTVKNYNAFVGSMERQVLPSARKLNALDETKVLGPLAGIEESPRELTAYELTTAAPAEVAAEVTAGSVEHTAPSTERIDAARPQDVNAA
ncbi:DNA recombination protein RmuC [Salinibacterium sp. ZJ450]|uniref:DNA recombination protein RmuC n=1 Tax=Salinibacterium sp. ZJ450 TaxID=2708338 RepID=UPI001420736A|nr:DNA recombination protein RmuC [Salinibacterium sp. ZJ450]